MSFEEQLKEALQKHMAIRAKKQWQDGYCVAIDQVIKSLGVRVGRIQKIFEKQFTAWHNEHPNQPYLHRLASQLEKEVLAELTSNLFGEKALPKNEEGKE